jgi:hypothetical protein
MTATEMARRVRLQEWAGMVTECRKSGKPVQTWCKENGIASKTYYTRRKRLREVLFEEGKKTGAIVVPEESAMPALPEASPTFAALPMMVSECDPVSHMAPQDNNQAAVTVHIGSYAADVQNGADAGTVEMVMRMLMRL